MNSGEPWRGINREGGGGELKRAKIVDRYLMPPAIDT